ncbi:MAG: hypothetical protein VB120_07665 [Lachnospiraceae bacterium]|nr:hypothetical protein [Lachnospiraceae bacterium]
MTITQLSVFVENKPGKLANIIKLLANANVDIRALSIADTSDFGILRIIVDDTEKALAAIKAGGLLVSKTDVLAAKVSDKPGGLSSLLTMLHQKGVDIEYMYSFIAHDKGNAYMVLRVEDTARVEAFLAENGYETVAEKDFD